MTQAQRRTAEADQVLDDEGRVIDDGGRLADDEDVVIVEDRRSSPGTSTDTGETLFEQGGSRVGKRGARGRRTRKGRSR